jgi:predicted metalloprotease
VSDGTSEGNQGSTPSITRAGALLAGAAVFAIGGLGYWAFQAAGFEGFSAGIATQALLVAIVLVWTGSYLFRVVSGNMTYMQQRRRYRSSYDAATEDELQKRFEALSPAEQEKLLRELGQLQDSSEL